MFFYSQSLRKAKLFKEDPQRSQSPLKLYKAFSLLEVTLVLILVGLIVNTFLPSFTPTYKVFEETKQVQEMRRFIQKAQLYGLDNESQVLLSFDAVNAELSYALPSDLQRTSLDFSAYSNRVESLSIPLISQDLNSWSFPWLLGRTGEILRMENENVPITNSEISLEVAQRVFNLYPVSGYLN